VKLQRGEFVKGKICDNDFKILFSEFESFKHDDAGGNEEDQLMGNIGRNGISTKKGYDNLQKGE
jgi:hypothetical protein